MPVGVKDLVAVAGMPMAGGSTAYRDFVPDMDDVVVERLRAAGAIVLGKTAVTEFGYSGASHSPVGETTRNPWNLALTSGGSSAGSGAAVAAGLGPVAIAADGGGSIRIPASFCGLFGMKASMGRVPMYPVLPRRALSRDRELGGARARRPRQPYRRRLGARPVRHRRA